MEMPTKYYELNEHNILKINWTFIDEFRNFSEKKAQYTSIKIEKLATVRNI